LDNVTHTLFAVTVGRTALGRAGRGTTAALVLASNIPDIDIVTALRGGTANYMHWHRGPTHGPIGVVALGFVSAAIVWQGLRWRPSRLKAPAPDATFLMLFSMSMIMIALHLLMDLPTSYGMRILSPFDWHWYAFDWLPIIDLYLLIALAAGLLFGNRSEEAKRRNAAIVLVIMAANYGVRAVAHHQALEIAPRLFGPTLPARCADAPDTSAPLDEWPRTRNSELGTQNLELRTQNLELRTQNLELRTQNLEPATRCLVEIAALPTFTSPFDWRILAQMSNGYEVHEVNLLDSRFREPAAAGQAFWRQSVRYPNVWTPAVARAAAGRVAQIFLGFSRFPAARAFTDNRGVTTVRFSDMRFAAGLIALEQPTQRRSAFTVTVRLDPNGRIVDESIGP
jgi:membrane-bound metal-dependent hydrolase YbcI (DUF457 family)